MEDFGKEQDLSSCGWFFGSSQESGHLGHSVAASVKGARATAPDVATGRKSVINPYQCIAHTSSTPHIAPLWRFYRSHTFHSLWFCSNHQEIYQVVARSTCSSWWTRCQVLIAAGTFCDATVPVSEPVITFPPSSNADSFSSWVSVPRSISVVQHNADSLCGPDGYENFMLSTASQILSISSRILGAAARTGHGPRTPDLPYVIKITTKRDQGNLDTKMMAFVWFKEEVTPMIRRRVQLDFQQNLTNQPLEFKKRECEDHPRT